MKLGFVAMLLALPVVHQSLPALAQVDRGLMAQSNDPQNGPTRPWTDANAPQGNASSTPNGYPQSNSSYPSQMPQTGKSFAGEENSAPAGTQAYTAPAGGFSSFSYGPPLQQARSESGAWTAWQAAPSHGIISSRMQAPSLPQGLVLPIQLDTSIDTERAQSGDYIQTNLSQNISGGGTGYLQGGSVISGTIVEAEGEKHAKHAAKLSVDFNQVRLPNGTLIPLKAHLVGRISNYIYRDNNPRSNSVMSAAWRDGLGSGLSSGMGSVFGSVSDGGEGPGGGAYAGALMGGASNLLTNMFYHRHQDIFLHPGTRLEMQLDAPLVLPGTRLGGNNNSNMPGSRSGPNAGIFLAVLLVDHHVPSLAELTGTHSRSCSGKRRNKLQACR